MRTLFHRKIDIAEVLTIQQGERSPVHRVTHWPHASEDYTVPFNTWAAVDTACGYQVARDLRKLFNVAGEVDPAELCDECFPPGVTKFPPPTGSYE